MAELVFDIDNTALETIGNLQIKANFEDMKAQLSEIVEPYKSLIVTDDGISQAKTDRAKLRKVAGHIDDRRKLVKKKYLELYMDFEEKCKELISICNEGVNNLDGQVKEFEAKAKAQKLLELQDYFCEAEKRNPSFMMFEACVNPKWTNATFPIDTAKLEIDTYILKVDRDVDAIRALNSNYEEMLLDKYRETGDVSQVLMLKQRLEEAEAQAEIRRQQKQVEKVEQQESVSPAPVSEKKPEAKSKARRFIVTCRADEDVAALEKFCERYQLDYQEVW